MPVTACLPGAALLRLDGSSSRTGTRLTAGLFAAPASVTTCAELCGNSGNKAQYVGVVASGWTAFLPETASCFDFYSSLVSQMQ